MKIRVTENGPYVVEGEVPLVEEQVVLGDDGEPRSWRRGDTIRERGPYALCRCGRAKAQPFCDGSHLESGFDGRETAVKNTPKEAEDITSGDGIDLIDVECRCSIARFCHREGDAWSLIEGSSDPHKKEIAVESALNCPSGRLAIIDKSTSRMLEPELSPSIGVVRDTYHDCEGPLWVKGGVPIESAEGETYEIRNRVTLCRCGASKNKPLCDGSHIKIRFGKGRWQP